MKIWKSEETFSISARGESMMCLMMWLSKTLMIFWVLQHTWESENQNCCVSHNFKSEESLSATAHIRFKEIVEFLKLHFESLERLSRYLRTCDADNLSEFYLGLCVISENMLKVFARIVIWGYVILKTVISISNQILNASAHMGISTFENYKHEHQIVRKASRFCAHGKKNIWRNRCHDYMNATAIQNIFGNYAIIIWKSEYTFSTSASIENTKY